MGVATGSLTNLATRVASTLGLLALTVVAARMGAQVQGAFALFASAEALLVAAGSGLGLALSRQVSRQGAGGGASLGLMRACTWLALGLGSAAAAALALAAWLAPASWWPAALLAPVAPGAPAPWLLLAVSAPVLLLAPTLSGWWLGQGRMGPLAALTLSAPWGALTLVLVLQLAGHAGLWPLLAAWVAARLAVAVCLMGVMGSVGRRVRPDWAVLRPMAGFVAAVGLANLVSLANYRVGLFVVERAVGVAEAGVYSIASVAAELLWFVSSAVTQAAWGRIGQPDRHAAAALTVRVLQLGVVALALAAPLLLALAWWIVPVLLGPEYAAARWPLVLLLPGVVLFGGASALSAWFTSHAGRPGVAARVAGLSLLLHGGLATWWVPLLGPSGAALAATTAFTVASVTLGWRFARDAGLPLAALWRPGPHLAADLRALARAFRLGKG